MSAGGEPNDTKAQIVRNERTKARATYLNGLAVAVLAVGGLAPIASAVASAHPPSPAASLLVVVCLGASFALHSWAITVLKDLEP